MELSFRGVVLAGDTDHGSERDRKPMEGFKQSNDVTCRNHFGRCVESRL